MELDLTTSPQIAVRHRLVSVLQVAASLKTDIGQLRPAAATSDPVCRRTVPVAWINSGCASAAWTRIVDVARLLYIQTMRSATFPPIRVEPEVRAEVEAVLRDGESLTQFIEEAVVAAAAWRRTQAEFVNRGEAAIARWKEEGGGRNVDEVLAGLQGRLEDAKRRAAKRTGR